MPESFKVLIKELKSLALDIKVLDADKNEIIIRELDDDDMDVDTSAPMRFEDGDEEAAPAEPEAAETAVDEDVEVDFNLDDDLDDFDMDLGDDLGSIDLDDDDKPEDEE